MSWLASPSASPRMMATAGRRSERTERICSSIGKDNSKYDDMFQVLGVAGASHNGHVQDGQLVPAGQGGDTVKDIDITNKGQEKEQVGEVQHHGEGGHLHGGGAESALYDKEEAEDWLLHRRQPDDQETAQCLAQHHEEGGAVQAGETTNVWPQCQEHQGNVDHPGLIEGLKHGQGEHQHGEGAEVNPLLTLMGNARLANWGSLVRRRSMKDPPKTKSVMTIWNKSYASDDPQPLDC